MSGPSTSSGPHGKGENLEKLIRACVSETLRACKKSVDEIAEEMTQRQGTKISRNMIYSWSSEARPAHRFPLALLPCWTRVTQDFRLLKVLLEDMEMPLPQPGHADMVAFAKARLQAELAHKEAEGAKARILGHRAP